MYQTDSFEAFNTFSLANLKCTSKFNPTDPLLSKLSLEYYFGLSEKYALTISETDLSYDLKFVIGNLKGLFDYLHSIHSESKFRLCEFVKDEVRITYLLKIFNQEKLITQEFKATLILDQVIWKSQLKNKIDNLQLSLSTRLNLEIDRKLKTKMFEEKQKSLMRIQSIEKKFSRQLQSMREKIEMISDLVRLQKNNPTQLFNSQKQVPFRGRFKEDESISRRNSSSNQNQQVSEDNIRRNTRAYINYQKTKVIQKPTKINNRIRRLGLANLNPVEYHSSSEDIQKMQNTPNWSKTGSICPARDIKRWEQQYEQFERIQNLSMGRILEEEKVEQKQVDEFITKQKPRSLRGSRQVTNDPINSGNIRSSQGQPQSLNIRKISPANQGLIQNKAKVVATFMDSRKIGNTKKSQQKENSLNNKSFNSNQAEKRQQVARQIKQSFESFSKNAIINSFSFSEPLVQKHKKALQKRKRGRPWTNKRLEEKLQKESLQKKHPSPSRVFKKQAKSKTEHSETSVNRRNIFSKNPKTVQLIDLQDEQQYLKFIVKINPNRGINDGIQNGQNHIKMEEQVHEELKQDIKEKNKQKKIKINKSNFEQLDQTSKIKTPSNSTPEKQDRKDKKSADILEQIFAQSPEKIIEEFNDDEKNSDSEQQIQELSKMVDSYKKYKMQERNKQNKQNSLILNLNNNTDEKQSKANQPNNQQFQGSSFNTPLKPTSSGNINSNLINQNSSIESLHELINPKVQQIVSTITEAKVPSFPFLAPYKHFVPDFHSRKEKQQRLKPSDYFEFDDLTKRITKHSRLSARGKKQYIPLLAVNAFPNTGKHFWSIRILASVNYHICMGIVDMPSEIKANEIPKNCDAVYILDGGLHDQLGGTNRQNGWRSKQGEPVNVLQMDLAMQKGQLYVIMLVNMDKEQIEFYYNNQFISKTHFSAECKRNKKRIHAFLALKSQKDSIQII